jgi:uncharacterized protein YkwD
MSLEQQVANLNSSIISLIAVLESRPPALGSVPTQAAPTQAAPTQAAPTQAAPTQAAPTQAAPTQAVPTQAAPTQAAPFDPMTSRIDYKTLADLINKEVVQDMNKRTALTIYLGHNGCKSAKQLPESKWVECYMFVEDLNDSVFLSNYLAA